LRVGFKETVNGIKILVRTSRRLSRFLSLLVFAIALCSGSAFAESDSGLDWLKAMRGASAHLTYKGVLVYIKDQQVDSFKLFHAFKDGQEQEKLVAMSSPMREVIRTAGNVSVYSKDGQHVVVETKPTARSLILDLPDDPALLSRFYQINLRGQEYVSGHLAQVVALEPKDDYRYTRLIWVDSQNKLPVKLEVLNEEGLTIEQMVFTSLTLENSISNQDLEPSVKSSAPISQISHRENRSLGSLNWTLTNVPEGFQIVSYVLVKRPPSDTPVEQVLLSDGFSSVSVYIEKRASAPSGSTRTVGAINVDTLYVDGYKITVMGEVPTKTVAAIAQGLKSKHVGGS